MTALHTMTIFATLEKIACCHDGCGIIFAVPSEWVKARREDHCRFYCPNGHIQYFSGKSDAEKLRDELTRQIARTDQARSEADRQQRLREHAERSANAYRGQVTRVRNRVGNGVCPCCNRSFNDLMRHMTTKHPDYAKAEPSA